MWQKCGKKVAFSVSLCLSLSLATAEIFKKEKPPKAAKTLGFQGFSGFFGGEQGIRTLEAVLATYTISNRAPSTSSDNSP